MRKPLQQSRLQAVPRQMAQASLPANVATATSRRRSQNGRKTRRTGLLNSERL
jgi:hypothetical protein